jgi:formamidopyrimidine-DNA glycosylase
MPELPEVETIIRELHSKILGEVFSGVELIWSRSFEADNSLPLINNRIIDISRKGKFILFRLNRGYLITHLRMTGQMIVRDSPPDNFQHLRLIFHFISGKHLLFYDLRKFGRVYLTNHPSEILINTGIDALDKDFTLDFFKKMLEGKRRKIKSFLLDQKNVAGLGNIYIDESLFRAKVHPDTMLTDLSQNKIRNLYQSIGKILLEAISRMGTTISDYKTTGGGFGENQNYLCVYGRKDQPCYTCGKPIVRLKLAGRGTHFCPKCQTKI